MIVKINKGVCTPVMIIFECGDYSSGYKSTTHWHVGRVGIENLDWKRGDGRDTWDCSFWEILATEASILSLEMNEIVYCVVLCPISTLVSVCWLYSSSELKVSWNYWHLRTKTADSSLLLYCSVGISTSVVLRILGSMKEFLAPQKMTRASNSCSMLGVENDPIGSYSVQNFYLISIIWTILGEQNFSLKVSKLWLFFNFYRSIVFRNKRTQNNEQNNRDCSVESCNSSYWTGQHFYQLYEDDFEMSQIAHID